MLQISFRIQKIGASLLLGMLLTGLGLPAVQAQPAEVKWFPVVKTAKDQRTLALLNAGPKGFQLLRWQDRRTDANGKITPAMPLLTVLTASGERVQDEPLPGFADGSLLFRFALANDSVLLIVYEASEASGQTLFARRLNLDKRQWSAAPEVILTDPVHKSPAFGTTWFSGSANGRYWCLYRLQGPAQARQVSITVLDADFRTNWKRIAPLPEQAGIVALRRVFCTNTGAVVLHAQLSNPDNHAKGQPFNEPPATWWPDGRPLYRAYDWAADMPAYTNGIYLLDPEEKTGMAAFYPEIGKKFTPSFEIAENADGQIYCAGFSGTARNDQVTGYFVYAIDPKTRQGTFLQNAPLPGPLRKAFLSEKAAAKKEPVEGIALRWLDWADDGKPWMLVERENFSGNPGRVEEAALLRLDSTYRITAVRKIEKFQQVQTGDAQNFASVAPCPAPKGGWWLLWNQGHWPETKLILTECHPSGNPVDFPIDASSRSDVTLLPQTLLNRDGHWYFVGESEYHERIRIGML